MPERKVWSAQEDKILKLLIEKRGLVKWSQISKVMEEEFHIQGRNGKQCRQRYHNHLAENIKNDEWTQEQQDILFKLQNEVGNKWALISNRLPGRTDNCVKNHFYSKLRKNLRKINKKINKHFKKQYRDIKTTTLYKIIEILQNKNKFGQIVQLDQQAELCRKIIDLLRTYDDQMEKQEDLQEQLMYVKSIIQDFALFDKELKKPAKKDALKSSRKLSDIKSSQAPNSKKVKSSTKSIYDDESSFSNSNSEMFSESNYKYKNRVSSNQLFVQSPRKIFRSQKLESGQSIELEQRQKIETLYNSATILNNLFEAQKSAKIMPQLQQQQGNKEHDISRQRSNSSKSEQNFKYLIGQQSYMLNIGDSPNMALTHSQIQQINKQNNEWLFGQQMRIDEEQMIVKDFSRMDLSIPKLGKDFF